MKICRSLFFSFFILASVFLNAQNNQWTWMKGSNSPNSIGSSGTLNVAAPGNNPPGVYEAAEWTDNLGRFWIYGGQQFAAGNVSSADLYMYNPATNMWTWKNGSGATNVAPVYGTQGVPAPANTPGSRKYAQATWTDLQGNLWLLGGFTINGCGNDLWKYDMGLNEWVWMHGSSTAFPSGNYGTQSVPAATNDPSYRAECSATWVDNSGNLWLFGGQGNGDFNDLWKYNIATNMWTWMNGSQFGFSAGNWGTIGVPAASNVPSGRLVYASWKDLSGDLWLFGGNDSSFFTGGGSRNDLWRYNIATNMWTWMSGTNLINDPGQYGSQCTSAITNVPSARLETRARWIDDCGNFWLFGGARYQNGTVEYNDLWKYNPQTNMWSWVSGSNSGNQAAVYGVQTVSAPANHPGARMGSVGWKNSQGLWLFGGAIGQNDCYNDLWKYVPDKATAAFSATPTSGCAPLTVQFTDQSAPNCTDINTWSWNFGDPASAGNNTSALQNPSHIYNAQGTYTVSLTVTSCFGFTDAITHVITVNAGLSVTSSTVPASCGNSNGSATVTVTSGTAPYTYAWTPSGGSAATANNLAAGNYTCTVTGAGGCQIIQPVVITSSGSFTTSVQSQNNVTCNGGTNGSATVSATGGTAPYTYSWAPSGGNAATATNLSSGIYTVTITDASTCSTTQTVSISQPTAITLATSSVAATCGSSNGSATVIPGGGNGPFTYSWLPSGGNSATENNIPAGTYTCTATDANGCTGTQSVTVANNSTLSASVQSQNNVTCNAGTNGSATINPTGGTGPYTYSWSPSGGTNATATNLASGIYTVTINDAGSCVTTVTVSITEPALITLAPSSTPATCGNNNGSASVVANGGTGPYTYAWTPSGGNSANAINLAGGNYTVTVTDANTCSAAVSISVSSGSAITATLSAQQNVSCNAGTNGSAAVNPSGGISPYTYSWSPSGGSAASATNLAAGIYTVTVTDAAGCVTNVNVTITEPQAISLTTSGNVTICSGNSTTLLASATGGSGSFAYTWNPGAIVSNSIVVSPSSTTAYLVTATDANGCTLSQPLTVTVDQPVNLIVLGTTQICGGQSAILTAVANNGGPYTWQPGNLSGGSVTVSPATTTTYTVSVFDFCTNTFVTDSVTVSVETLTTQFIQTPANGCGPLLVQFNDQSVSSNGNITSWLWDFGDGSFSTNQDTSHLFTASGSYNVSLTVTTANGCTQTFINPTAVIVYPSPVADFSITNLPVTTIDPHADLQDNSTNAVSWIWDFGDGGTSTLQNPSHTYLSDTGSYNIILVVSNSYGCTDTAYGELTVHDEFSFYIPNAFSPNGDLLNDDFSGIGRGIADYHLLVFDRWGMLIYESHDINKPWDGTYKSRKVEEDVYVYKIDITDIFNAPHHYIGHVSVVR
jgi:gliding motility-associated-like protein